MVEETHQGVLGRTVMGPLEGIEVLQIAATPSVIEAVSTEVYGLCPVTEQPDLYTVSITYPPVEGYVVESKSLKLYLWKFKDRGISCEELSATIAQELAKGYQEQTGHTVPFTVEATQQPRGGITITATTTAGQ